MNININQQKCCNMCECINPNVGKNYKTIKVTNRGLFIAWFSISYIDKGQFVSKRSDEFGTGRTEKIKIPDTCVQCTFIASFYLAPQQAQIVCEYKFPYAADKCYLIRGTVADANCTEVPCSSSNNLCKYNCCSMCNYYIL